MRQVKRTVGRYEILGELGRGGMAIVHLANDMRLGRNVALKELRVHRADEPELVERFEREARMAASLNHANVVTVHDFIEDDGRNYIVMELVEGGSLRPRVQKATLAQVLGVVEGMLAGLGYAHERGFVHRDVKPENVLVGADGRVKIADFGIARALDQPGSALTQTGAPIGTPRYMAPEQVGVGEVGAWTDLYATGLVAFELLTGGLPFDADPAHVAKQRIVIEPAASARDREPGLDAGIAAWVGWMLATDPAARPADAAIARAALEQHAIRLFGTTHLPPLDAGIAAGELAASHSSSTRAASAQPAASAAGPSPGARSSRLSPRAVAAALATVLVVAAGLATGSAVRGHEPSRSLTTTAITGAAFGVRVPDGWRRAGVETRVPGIALEQPLAVGPRNARGTRMVAGFVDAEGPALLKLNGRELARPDADDAEAVMLGALQALRYRGVAVAGQPGTRLTLYAIPTDRAVATVACIATPPAAAAALATCEGVATTLTLRSAKAAALGPDATYARAVSAILDRLDARRLREGRALRSAKTAAGQAKAAARAGRSYELAARSLGALRPGRRERPATRGHRLRAAGRARRVHRTGERRSRRIGQSLSPRRARCLARRAACRDGGGRAALGGLRGG